MKSCATCEFFDAGGELETLRAVSGAVLTGDCGCVLSDRFTPPSNHVCDKWFENTTLDALQDVFLAEELKR